MKTDKDTQVKIVSICWELLSEVEAVTNPDKDFLNKRLVDEAYRVLHEAGALSANTKPRWSA